VREWILKGRELFSHTVVKKERKRIAVDEKIIKRGDIYLYLWAAVDLDDEQVISVMATTGRSYVEAIRFIRRVKRVCKGKLPRVFVDGGMWYPWALQTRSVVERFFSLVDRRIRRFWETFPSNGQYPEHRTVVLKLRVSNETSFPVRNVNVRLNHVHVTSEEMVDKIDVSLCIKCGFTGKL